MARLSVQERYARAMHLCDVELRLADAERELRAVLRALAAAPAPGGGPSARRVMLSLAHVRAERGHVQEGLAILDRLAADGGDNLGGDNLGGDNLGGDNLGGGDLGGLVLSQRGLLHLRAGRLPEALRDLDSAVPALAGTGLPLVRVLMNRGMLHLGSGALAQARADLERCAAVAVENDLPVHAARARHNLGYVRWLEGDLPAALAAMDAAHADRAGAGPGGDAVYHLDRARVLYSAGLLAESDADLAAAVHAFATVGSRQDRAECELNRAQIALVQGRQEDARALARGARRGFDRRGSRGWSLLAELVELRAEVTTRRVRPRTPGRADALAGELAAAGLEDDAAQARIAAARAHLARGDVEGARAGPPPLRRGEPILTRLAARELRADLAAARGDLRGCDAELRAALEELHRYQSSFGSLDLQTAVTGHARTLAGKGLRGALRDGRPAQVFTWSERARALASRLPPVRPPRDPEAAALLEQLRFVRTELRQRELAGQDDPTLRARRVELERRIRQRSWYAAGPGEVEGPVTLAAVRRALAGDGRRAALVVHLAVGSELVALTAGDAAPKVVRLGEVGAVLETVRRVRADLDALALRGVPDAVRRSVEGSLRRCLALLDTALWSPVADAVGDRDVVLVPSGALVAVPWTCLPSLSGRPLTVARSATAWVRSRGRVPSRPSPPQVLLAAGPDLDHAEAEIAALGRLWDGAASLTGRRATTEAVAAGLAGRRLVHVAAHGVHEPANPLFSALRLADGPLFGYDLVGVPEPPEHVVLSACDLGLATQRPGDELLGMTAALLHAGSTCVVASVARVADEVAAQVLLDYHGALRRGLAPSAALATATAGRDDAPFVCFGAGL